MTWVLILLIYVGPMTDREAIAITNVPGFKSQQECEIAAAVAKGLVAGSTKSARTVCVSQSFPSNNYNAGAK